MGRAAVLPGRDAADPGVGDRGRRSRRRALVLLALATVVGSTGLGAGGTAGALVGADLAGTSAGAGLPIGLLVVGSAVGALVVSWQAGQGRRGRGLVFGYLLGVAGALVVIAAVQTRSLSAVLVGSTVLGAANSSVFMTRYAAAQVGTDASRGRAMGVVFFATAVGAVFSPMLLGPSGTVAEAAGLRPLTGLYLVAAASFGIAAVTLAAAASPRISRLGHAARVLASGRAEPGMGIWALAGTLRGGGSGIALVALAASNLVMVAIMAIAPVHLRAGGHSLATVGGIVALHVVGMFAPSPVSGHLVDRLGAVPVVLLGGGLLLVAGVTGLFVQQHSLLTATGHLVVLGVGWNCGVVGGSALLAATVPDGARPHAEGIGEVSMGLAAAVAAPAAGFAVALGSYWTLSLVSVAVAGWLLAVVHRSVRR